MNKEYCYALKKIDKLREKLHLLIVEKANYSEILRVSEELDICIAEVTAKNLRDQLENLDDFTMK